MHLSNHSAFKNALFFFIFYLFLFQLNNCYLFSVIISIYNTEKYLNDSIESIINQTIGFEKIQLILVNDGSIDNSEKICLYYRNKYPNNIIYIKIDHGGVSKARNIGLSYINGSYINFLDSDDKWDSKAFYFANLFFKYSKGVDLIGGRLKYFESSSNYHILDYKFYRTRTTNLVRNYDCIQLHASSSFFRANSIKYQRFDEMLSYGEDVKFIKIQNIDKSINNSLILLNHIHLYLINKSKELYNYIIPFIQYYIAYDFLFRIWSPAYKYCDSIIYYKYSELLKKILLQIKDKYILEQKVLPSKIKILALSKKYSRDIRYDIILKNNLLFYSNYILLNITDKKCAIVWKIMKIEGNVLHLEGEDRFWLPRDNYYYFCQLGNKISFPRYYIYDNFDFDSLYGKIIKGRIVIFDIKIELNKRLGLYFYISYNDKIIEIFPSLDSISHLPPINNSYYSATNFIIKNINNHLIIYPFKKKLKKYFEEIYEGELNNLNKNYLNKFREKLLKAKEKNDFKVQNQIWLINDRKNLAGDNGEYFFRYLNKLRPKHILYYFAIEKNCSDYYRLKMYNNILNINSKEYISKFLKADKIITSTTESWVINPVGLEMKYLKDLIHFKYIYLTNGIVKDDLSKFLNKIKTNFDIIITSSKKEYKALLYNNYGYNKKNIILTGLPRFDNLKELQENIQSEKILLIYPTWRMYIKGTIDLIKHISIESKTFKNSTYFIHYNNLINDNRLINIMKKNDYKGILCIHPNFLPQKRFFHNNELFEINNNCNNQELFVKSSILITDYSSIFFDFGYIKKPVIYYHFDYSEYRKYHFPEGYFDYVKYGFGPICNNIECIIKNILFEIENSKLIKKYEKRMNGFFQYSDRENCKRVFDGIKGKDFHESNSFNKYNIINLILLTIFIKKFIMKI